MALQLSVEGDNRLLHAPSAGCVMFSGKRRREIALQSPQLEGVAFSHCEVSGLCGDRYLGCGKERERDGGKEGCGREVRERRRGWQRRSREGGNKLELPFLSIHWLLRVAPISLFERAASWHSPCATWHASAAQRRLRHHIFAVVSVAERGRGT